MAILLWIKDSPERIRALLMTAWPVATPGKVRAEGCLRMNRVILITNQRDSNAVYMKNLEDIYLKHIGKITAWIITQAPSIDYIKGRILRCFLPESGQRKIK
jgi:hypothetical protein